ncbi:ABC-type Co2+ transport system, permease component [Xenococcus sp. PCC 7305]|uniref:cobalt transporter CbiM n=1 Tax=Xenococcus sp. PCC 7305 TaxID=102125 RepID=UPI0002AD0C60|nr:cobalt transporter CbiM [Xenococcus sp. PCC 7305]ELS04324.1 ABC-type Co2+ transport system, permease component [Xenococcus sp. PCC 7305]
MHIPDGFIPPSICITGYALAGGLTWYSLKKIQQDPNPQANIPKASLLTAAFFVVSSIHIPLPPTSIHLILNGLMGTLLGYYAFLAIPIGLFFQAVIFSHGGMSTLGVNTIIMGVPAIVAYHLFRWREHVALPEKIRNKVFAFLSGMLAIMLSATIFSVIAILTITPDLDATLEQRAIFISLISYGIQGLIEGSFTFMLISFLEQVKPELLKI